MPVPFQALIPLGIISALYLVAGESIGALQRLQNLGKPKRVGVDGWDRAMMHRNEALTGHKYGQSDHVIAPDEFSLTSYKFIRKLSKFQ